MLISCNFYISLLEFFDSRLENCYLPKT